MLFDEAYYSIRSYKVNTFPGLPTTSPNILFTVDRKIEQGDDLYEVPSCRKIDKFIFKIFLNMKLANEICLLALIFIERLIVNF